jgi:hypothetical protein
MLTEEEEEREVMKQQVNDVQTPMCDDATEAGRFETESNIPGSINRYEPKVMNRN